MIMRNKLTESIVSSGLPNVKFGDNVVGSATPSKDKINQALLNDVSAAAKSAGVEVTITTAVTGHKKGSRHEVGNAVDIAVVNGYGFSGGVEAAKKNKIYDSILKFVSALQSMGYVKNSERGNDKAVLTFGFPGHENHIHVSRKSGGSEDQTPETIQSVSSSDNPQIKSEPSNFEDLFKLNKQDREAGLSKLVKKYFGENKNINLKNNSTKLNEEIERIKKLF